MQMSTSRTLHCRGQAPAASLAARALTVCSTAARGLPSLALSVASHGAYDSSARSLPAAPRAAAAEPARRDVRTHASEAATSQPSTSGVRPPSTFGHGITYTSYEGNSFAVKFNTTGVRVLVDPWLQGDLVFAEQTWLYKGKKRVLQKHIEVDLNQIAEETDVVLLTQALDDHTHMPTLRALPKGLTVVACPEAAARIAPLGFRRVVTVDHGQSTSVCDGRLIVTATKGALVGPPWSKRQNGFVLREGVPQAASLYYEPHCDFDEASVKAAGRVDLVISPVKSTLLSLGVGAYPLVQGDANIARLLRLLQPRVLVPLLNAEIDQEGPLGALLIERGSLDGLQERLQAEGISVRVDMPAPPGESLAIAL